VKFDAFSTYALDGGTRRLDGDQSHYWLVKRKVPSVHIGNRTPVTHPVASYVTDPFRVNALHRNNNVPRSKCHMLLNDEWLVFV
jgi:hypothetical protein